MVTEQLAMRGASAAAPASAVALTLIVALTGCAPANPPLYRWGIYEDQLYASYTNPGEEDPATAAARLSEDVERAQAEGQSVAPGVHAQLGYLYYSQGDIGLARTHLERERQLFPESATFIDGMLARLGKQ